MYVKVYFREHHAQNFYRFKKNPHHIKICYAFLTLSIILFKKYIGILKVFEMDESLYDEFGNYIGDSDDSDAEIESNSSDEDVSNSENEISEDEKEQEKESTSKAIVLHEDKQYHPSISQVFSPDVEVTIQHTDTQSLNVPLVKPTINKKIIV